MKERINFYVNTWIFGKVSLREILERVASLGYKGVELIGEPKDYDPKEVNNLIEGEGLLISTITGMYPGTGQDELRALSHFEEKERRKAIDYVKSCIDLANQVGAYNVVVAPSPVGYLSYFKSKEDDRKWAIDSLQRLSEYAENKRVVLTIESINRYEVSLINTLDEAIDMAKECNNSFVKIMGDTFHMQIEEDDGIPNAIRRAGNKWFKHLHAADNTRVAPGKGTMEWKEIIRALYDINYEGAISLEPLPRESSPYDALNKVIPREKLDSDLGFAFTYLERQQEVVIGHLTDRILTS